MLAGGAPDSNSAGAPARQDAQAGPGTPPGSQVHGQHSPPAGYWSLEHQTRCQHGTRPGCAASPWYRTAQPSTGGSESGSRVGGPRLGHALPPRLAGPALHAVQDEGGWQWWGLEGGACSPQALLGQNGVQGELGRARPGGVRCRGLQATPAHKLPCFPAAWAGGKAERWGICKLPREDRATERAPPCPAQPARPPRAAVQPHETDRQTGLQAAASGEHTAGFARHAAAAASSTEIPSSSSPSLSAKSSPCFLALAPRDQTRGDRTGKENRTQNKRIQRERDSRDGAAARPPGFAHGTSPAARALAPPVAGPPGPLALQGLHTWVVAWGRGRSHGLGPLWTQAGGPWSLLHTGLPRRLPTYPPPVCPCGCLSFPSATCCARCPPLHRRCSASAGAEGGRPHGFAWSGPKYHVVCPHFGPEASFFSRRRLPRPQPSGVHAEVVPRLSGTEQQEAHVQAAGTCPPTHMTVAAGAGPAHSGLPACMHRCMGGGSKRPSLSCTSCSPGHTA